MTEDQIIVSLLNIINEYSKIQVDKTNFLKLRIVEDCGYDSIQIIELVCTIEDVFSVEIDELDYEQINNLGCLYENIKNMVQ